MPKTWMWTNQKRRTDRLMQTRCNLRNLQSHSLGRKADSQFHGILTVFQRFLVYGSRRFLENASSDKVAGPREA